jgi:hypothetical protein
VVLSGKKRNNSRVELHQEASGFGDRRSVSAVRGDSAMKHTGQSRKGILMEARTLVSRRSKLVTTRGVVANILRWFTEIRAAAHKLTKHVLRLRHPASAERRAESDDVVAGAVATAPVTTDKNVGLGAGINGVADNVLDQQEIERRRHLVRMLFNDFWSGIYEKPAAFVERLDEAEDYLNERLAASGEFWRLDANTRVKLGLPPRSNSSNDGRKTTSP